MNISTFDRTAYNLANMGYFPTSEQDCIAIGSHLEGYNFTIIDPCCGAGAALNTITKSIHRGHGETMGIEIEEGRAEKAKQVLDAIIHEDLFNLSIEKNAFGAVFLNPPYYKDEALHQPFIDRATEILAPEGILILIIPDYEVSGKTASYLASFYENIQIYKAIDQRFNQVIFYGQKKKSSELQEGDTVTLLARKAKTIKRITGYHEERYDIPKTKDLIEIRILVKTLDPKKIEAMLKEFKEDWKKLTALIPESNNVKRPLLPMRRGHLAQSLASGFIDGIVTHPETGMKYLIKGSTNRIEEVAEETEDEVKVVSKDVVTILMMDQNGTIETIK